MKKIIVFVFLLFLSPQTVSASQTWYYPISGFENRQNLKTFNQQWTREMYIGKEALFPTQFEGYHSGLDIEATKEEENSVVPIYAVADGSITFAGTLQGYGFVILQKLANENNIVIYGHVKPSVSVGQSVTPGQQIGVLGKGFSNETANERKHLHLGIVKGTANYFKGYESTTASVQANFENPTTYLKARNASEPNQTPVVSPIPAVEVQMPEIIVEEKPSFWQRIVNWFKNLF